MRKILSTSFILLTFLILAWGVAAWYFSNKTESGIKSLFVKSKDLSRERPFRAELIVYQKTLLGAKAKIRITSDHSLFNNSTNEIVLLASAINGPLFISKTDFVINFGVSRWNIKIDKTSLDEDTLALLDRVFLEELPEFIITQGFDEKLLYQSLANSAIAQLKLMGIFDYHNNDNKGSLLMKNVQFGKFPDQIQTEQAILNYQYYLDADSDVDKEYKPATLQLNIPQLSIDHHSLSDTIKLGVTADAALLSETHNKVEVLNGLLKLDLKQLKQVAPFKIPIKHADVKLQFDKIPIQGLIQISEQRAEEDNLQKQIQWLLDENGEFPEGQDQIWQLNDQLKTLRKESASRYAGLFLSNNSSNVRLTANTEDQYAKKSTLQGSLHLKEDNGSSLNNTENNFNLLVGEAEVSLTENLFKYINTKKVKTKIALKNNAFKLYLKDGNFSTNERPQHNSDNE